MTFSYLTDDDLRAAASHLSDTLIRHAVIMDPGWGGGPEGIRAFVTDQATRCMTLDPRKIVSELDRLREVVKDIDSDRGNAINDSLDEARQVLEQWTGNAAESFRGRLRDLKAFNDVQHERSAAYVKALGALTALAVQTRSDFHTVVKHTIMAADQARATARKEGVAFVIKVGGALAKAAFAGFKPSDIAGSATDIVVEGVVLHIGAGSFTEVMTGYQNAVHGVVMGLNTGLSQVEAELREATAGIYDTRDALASPLPSNTRVSSPDFRYEAFATDSRSVAEFGPSVAVEKKRMRPEPARQSTIGTRLAGEPE